MGLMSLKGVFLMRLLLGRWESDRGGEGGKSRKPPKCIVLGDTAI